MKFREVVIAFNEVEEVVKVTMTPCFAKPEET